MAAAMMAISVAILLFLFHVVSFDSLNSTTGIHSLILFHYAYYPNQQQANQ